jgi:hypothetical protein
MSSPQSQRRLALAFLVCEGAVILAAASLVAWLGSRAQVFTTEGYLDLALARSIAGGHGAALPWNDGGGGRLHGGYALALVLPWKLFGEAGFWVLAGLLHAAAGLLLARLTRMLDLRPGARLAALALALFNPLVLASAATPAPEPLLAVLALGCVIFARRWRAGAGHWSLLLAAACAGIAFAVQPQGLAVLALAALIGGRRVIEEKRWSTIATVAALAFGPQLVWLLVASPHLMPAQGALAIAQGIEAHRGIGLFWRHVRAPFSTAFRLDVPPWLYSRYFPEWLGASQALVLVLYLGAMIAALLSGLFERGFAFVCSVGIVGCAAVWALLGLAGEQHDYLVAFAAALVFAWAFDLIFFWAGARLRILGAVGLALACAMVSAASGMRSAQMHGARLGFDRSDGKGWHALAGEAGAGNAERVPAATDLGPAAPKQAGASI